METSVAPLLAMGLTDRGIAAARKSGPQAKPHTTRKEAQ